MLLIIGMVLTSILGISQKALNKTYINQNVNSDLSYALEYIKDEIEGSDYYTNIGDKIYFIKEFQGKYIYINYDKMNGKLYRFASTEKNLTKFDLLEANGKNALTENIEDFRISDEGNYFSVYLNYNDLDKINFKIAKRIQFYE